MRLRCDSCGKFINPKSKWIWVEVPGGHLSPEDPLVHCEKCKDKKPNR